MTPIIERAPAKINLYLHLTDRRTDGLHELESLVVFARTGIEAADQVLLEKGRYQLDIVGPYGAHLAGEDPQTNLITKALRVFAEASGLPLDFSIRLEKNLPIASGIGGGSADAAASLRAAARHHNLPADHPALLAGARAIGSDGLCCYWGRTCMMRGTGDDLETIQGLPGAFLLLANPNIPLPTGPVYQARAAMGAPYIKEYTPAEMFERIAGGTDELAERLKTRRNDLQEAAVQMCGVVGDVLSALSAQQGCMLARLSGSGATCFGLFGERELAEAAAAHIRAQVREWWLAVTEI